MQVPEANDWLSTFGVAPEEVWASEPWMQSITLTPGSEEALTLSWHEYEGSLRLVWQQKDSVRVDVHRDGVQNLRIEDRRGAGTFVLFDYDSDGMVGTGAVQVWPSFGLADALRYDHR